MPRTVPRRASPRIRGFTKEIDHCIFPSLQTKKETSDDHAQDQLRQGGRGVGFSRVIPRRLALLERTVSRSGSPTKEGFHVKSYRDSERNRSPWFVAEDFGGKRGEVRRPLGRPPELHQAVHRIHPLFASKGEIGKRGLALFAHGGESPDSAALNCSYSATEKPVRSRALPLSWAKRLAPPPV